MKTLKRSVKTIRDSTSIVKCFMSEEFQEVVVSKLNERKTRQHFIVYQFSAIAKQKPYHRVAVLAEVAPADHQLVFNTRVDRKATLVFTNPYPISSMRNFPLTGAR